MFIALAVRPNCLYSCGNKYVEVSYVIVKTTAQTGLLEYSKLTGANILTESSQTKSSRRITKERDSDDVLLEITSARTDPSGVVVSTNIVYSKSENQE